MMMHGKTQIRWFGTFNMWSLSVVVVQNSKEDICEVLLFGDTRHTLENIAVCSFQYGLYSAFVGCFVYVVFGSCKDITIGPTALMALMTYQQVIGRNVDFAILLCFLTGCVQLLMAVLHLGMYVLLSYFYAHPVNSMGSRNV
jgi:hypothetical protein